jgi:hypothetical protein
LEAGWPGSPEGERHELIAAGVEDEGRRGDTRDDLADVGLVVGTEDFGLHVMGGRLFVDLPHVALRRDIHIAGVQQLRGRVAEIGDVIDKRATPLRRGDV